MSGSEIELHSQARELIEIDNVQRISDSYI